MDTVLCVPRIHHVSDVFEQFADEVLDIVDRIPPARAVTYGDISAYLGRGGPRGVGSVMARDGAAVTWWRVVRADGALTPHLMIDAQRHWHLEGMPLRRGVIDLVRARWSPDSTYSAGQDVTHA